MAVHHILGPRWSASYRSSASSLQPPCSPATLTTILWDLAAAQHLLTLQMLLLFVLGMIPFAFPSSTFTWSTAVHSSDFKVQCGYLFTWRWALLSRSPGHISCVPPVRCLSQEVAFVYSLSPLPDCEILNNREHFLFILEFQVPSTVMSFP